MYGAAEMDDAAENIWLDVTTPMQALVHNSQLHIPGGDTKVMDEPLSYPILCWFHDFLTSCRLLCRVSRTLHLLLPSLCEFATCSADACIMRRFLTTCLWFCLWQVCFHVLSLCFSFISDLGPIFLLSEHQVNGIFDRPWQIQFLHLYNVQLSVSICRSNWRGPAWSGFRPFRLSDIPPDQTFLDVPSRSACLRWDAVISKQCGRLAIALGILVFQALRRLFYQSHTLVATRGSIYSGLRFCGPINHAKEKPH